VINVLVIDDVQANLDVIEVILEDLEVNLYSALSGDEALKILVQTDIDLIITDLMMPKMNGLELTRIVRQNRKYKDIPIMVVTANTDKSNEELLYKEGVFEYITKPIDSTKLTNKIKALSYSILEAKYRQKVAKKHEQEKKMIERFLHVFTHELRTPLNLIYNFSSIMKKKIQKDDYDQEKFLKYLTSIEGSCSDMMHSINNLLTIGRIKNGHQHYEKERFDLVELINKVLKNFKLAFESRGVSVEFLHSEEEITIDCDKNSVSGIINNILSNAYKYGKDKIKITLDRYDDGVSLEIEDNGEGIKDKEHIFDIYKMEHSNSSTTSSGVGLYFVKLVCEDLGIDYGVDDSKELGGAKFFLDFKGLYRVD